VPDIFLSYAKEDLARARTLAESLQSVGWSVWWDRRLRPGVDFAKVIGVQLQEARCVIVLWSQVSVTSGWVRDEASEALKRNVLIPLLIDVVEPPLGFRAIQTGDLCGWSGDVSDSTFRQLIADLVPMLGDPAEALHASTSTVRPPMPPSLGPASDSKRSPEPGAGMRRLIALSGIGAAIVGAIVWAGLAYIARTDRKPGESATQEPNKKATQLPAPGAPQKPRVDPNVVVAKESVPKHDKKEAAGARYRRMDFGFNGCGAKFGQLLRGVTEEEMIKRASAANSSGFTFHPALGYGELLLGEYPKDCRSPSNLSWPLYLRD
jgi:TIR domain-containing protein